MKNFAVLVLAIAALFASTSAVEAGGGGGGAKKNAKIKVVNNTSGPAAAVGIILNSNANSWVSLNAALKAGGVVIQPGKSQTFDVVAGSNEVAGFDPNAVPVVKVNPATITAVKNKTITITLSGPATSPTATVSGP